MPTLVSYLTQPISTLCSDNIGSIEASVAKLFFLFAVLPIAEIALLINVGEQIGGWYTVAIVILTAFFGARLVRQEGLNTLAQAQQKMRVGQMPNQEMAEGLLLVIAGVLLVTPGFITDGFGFLLSLPMTRPLIAKKLASYMTVNMASASMYGGASQSSFTNSPFEPHAPQQSSDIIEGEFEEKDQEIKPSLRKPD